MLLHNDSLGYHADEQLSKPLYMIEAVYQRHRPTYQTHFSTTPQFTNTAAAFPTQATPVWPSSRSLRSAKAVLTARTQICADKLAPTLQLRDLVLDAP